jgi:hypothetical protein
LKEGKGGGTSWVGGGVPTVEAQATPKKLARDIYSHKDYEV